ncbi:hypothetical protein Sjap_020828 [Stephania japonica]|uniref:Ycf20-like protein n=1 Tax=Stephania japonica TaxID=461633 RepID=A0AAP0I0Z5_9MAGN
MGVALVQPIIQSVKILDTFERPCSSLTTCYVTQSWSAMPRFGHRSVELGIKPGLIPNKRCQIRRRNSSIYFALNTGGTNGVEDGFNSDNFGLGQTRLGRIVGAGGKRLLEKLNEARKNFPMKIFLLLLGFYTANALATILGQTGDWDVLVAGVVVAAIEGIGMLMYKEPPRVSNARLKSLVGMVNYWKAGVCLGLFVDAFKLGS